LIDSSLCCIGQFQFGFSIIFPFDHPGLVVDGSTETYWKSTEIVTHGESHSSKPVKSFITSSSLNKEYIELIVQFTRDHKIVVWPDWTISLNGLKFGISSLSHEHAKSLIGPPRQKVTASTSSELVSYIYGSLLTLDEAINVSFGNLDSSFYNGGFNNSKIPNVKATTSIGVVRFTKRQPFRKFDSRDCIFIPSSTHYIL
jgi:hypothetical protein